MAHRWRNGYWKLITPTALTKPNAAAAGVYVFDQPESRITPIMEHLERTRWYPFVQPATVGRTDSDGRYTPPHIEFGIKAEGEACRLLDAAGRCVAGFAGDWRDFERNGGIMAFIPSPIQTRTDFCLFAVFLPPTLIIGIWLAQYGGFAFELPLMHAVHAHAGTWFDPIATVLHYLGKTAIAVPLIGAVAAALYFADKSAKRCFACWRHWCRL